jgi:Hint module
VHNLGDLTLKLGKDKCSFIQNIGKFICFCQGGKLPEENTCTLCDDGSPIPNPNREIMPGFTCAEMQVNARHDFPYNCRVYQNILGSYCSCNTSKTSAQYCRLCDGGLLPDPLKTVNDMSCIEHEFEASLEKTCPAKRAEVGKKCCKVSGCFSGNLLVSLEDGTQVTLPNLRVGDMIMDGNNSYTQINSFGHRNTKKTMSYLQIDTKATNRPLQVSFEHMVFQANDNSQ